MNTTYFYFLIESSVCLLVFLAIYRVAISNLTHFNWMRGYILSSIVLSILLPLIKIPGQWSYSIFGNTLLNKPLSFNLINPLTLFTPTTIEQGMQVSNQATIWSSLIIILSVIYLAGVCYNSYKLFRNLLQISESIRRNPKHREGKYWIIRSDNEATAYSFLNYIFITGDNMKFTPDEIRQIKNHEYIHASQWHTIDILFIEFAGILFWFSPLIRYAKIKIREIHEYIADEKTAGTGR